MSDIRDMNTNELIDMLLSDYSSIETQIDFSAINNKKILITGASGLVGVHILSSLLYLKNTLNYNIFVLAVVNSEPETWFKELIEMGDFGYSKGDLSNLNFVNGLLDVDYIFHCATYAQPIKFTQEAIKTITLNTTTTNALIGKLKPNGKFLFMSSSEIYSGLDKEQYDESDIGTTTPEHPRACYIEGKRCGEAICQSHINQGVDVKIVRLCLAYGNGIKMSDTRAMNSFILQALTNNNIKLMDGGDATRNYIYVADAVSMIWNILLHGRSNVYNVGGNSQVTILELSKIIGDYVDCEVIVPENQDGLKGSPSGVNLDLTKYRNEFGVTNFVSLENGVIKVIEWCKHIRR